MIQLEPIGVIHTPFTVKDGMPIQSSRSDIAGSLIVYPEFTHGLVGLAEFSHAYLIYLLHESPEPVQLRVKPFLDDQEHGVFATRFPNRPNHLGLSIVRITGATENTVLFEGADMLNGTPLLDIKPYIPEFDIFDVTRIGWYAKRKYK